MTRGKYAAKAANRLAALDNDLLAEKVAKISELEGRIAALDVELVAERSDRQALILQRANELSAEQIAVVRQHLNESEAQKADALREAATCIGELFHARGYASVDFITKVLPKLIPDDAERSDHIAKYHMDYRPPNRRDRRHIATAIDRGLAASQNGAAL